MSYHIQFESIMTLSGANADNRIPTNPTIQKKLLPKYTPNLPVDH